ncbi:UPF0669 protein C6orf120 homolog [Convolutriloba macropyga]|uniref:UPF0669 protein C6orf120 homolog n=1 Tax=Convolutriloba macropyga TaxID=536237 RepID=UPI003F51B640
MAMLFGGGGERRSQVIYANNYTVFSVRNPGKVVLTLTSLTGDADLYAAESPSEFASAESYDLSSYSCGSDVIAIPYDFKRPVSVAIHGHPFAEETTYRLEAQVLEVKEVDGFLETENREEEESLGPDHNSDRDSKGGTVEIFVTVLFKCLEILADILL